MPITTGDLKVGDLSDPVESLDNEGRNGNTVYKIVRVDAIIPAHPATRENDFSLLADQVKAQLENEVIDKFVEEKIKTTYIRIDPIFKDCEFSKPSWSTRIVQ